MPKVETKRHAAKYQALKASKYSYDPNEENVPKGYRHLYSNRDNSGSNAKPYLYQNYFNGETPQSNIYDIFYNHNRDEYMISFKGTSTGSEIYEDIKGVVTPARALSKGNVRGKIHSGFADTYEALYDDFKADLRKIPKGATVKLTGHSLGGAMAQLAAADLHNEGYRVKSLTTFGAPSVGNKEYMKRYPKLESNVRVVNEDDPVTNEIPGLHHVGRKHYHSRNYGALSKLGNLLIRSTAFGAFSAVGAHKLQEYNEMMQNSDNEHQSQNIDTENVT